MWRLSLSFEPRIQTAATLRNAATRMALSKEAAVLLGATGASLVAASLCARRAPRVVARGAATAAAGASATPPVSTGGNPGPGEVALVDTELRKLVANRTFDFPFHPDLDGYVQPASIDLPLAQHAWLVKEKVLPFQKSVKDLLESLALEKCSLEGDGAMLLRGQTYLVHCGSISLPAGHRGLLSPKSSIGRVDLMVRGIVDQCGLYDIIDGGERRELWLEISPQSFNVRAKAGIALTQLMVFADAAAAPGGSASTTDDAAAASSGAPVAPRPLVFDDVGDPLPLRLYKDMLILSLRVPGGGEDGAGSESAAGLGSSAAGRESPRSHSVGLLAGYEAVTTNEVIDLSQVGAHDPTTFFRPVYAEPGAGKMTLEKDRFYILATKVNTRTAKQPHEQARARARAHIHTRTCTHTHMHAGSCAPQVANNSPRLRVFGLCRFRKKSRYRWLSQERWCLSLIT